MHLQLNDYFYTFWSDTKFIFIGLFKMKHIFFKQRIAKHSFIVLFEATM